MGAGETISHRADFNPEGKSLVQEETGFVDPAVGFKYEYFSLFFLDLWTGAGEIVVYEKEGGDRYVEMTDEQLHALTGQSPDAFGTPFGYRFPLGWFVVLGVLSAAVFATWRRMRELR